MSVGDILAKAGVQAARQGVQDILQKAGVGQPAPDQAAPVQSSPKKTGPERIENIQSPELSYGERTFLNTVPATVDQQVDVLRQKGFEAKVDERSGDVVLRRPGKDPTWYKIEKTGW